MSEQGKEPELDIADKIKIAIEDCLMQYMTKQECLDSVSKKCNFHPSAVECVWQRLKIENPDYFNAYYRRLELTKQIVKFNHLLSQQVELMRASGSAGQYISAPSALPTANTHYDNVAQIQHSCDCYAQVSPNLLMSQHGNESMFHPFSCCCAAAPGSLFQPSTGVPYGYTRVSPNTVVPHNQNGSLFQPSTGVASNGYAQFFPNMSISPDMIRPSMAGACFGYVQASQYTNNGSFVHPSLAVGGDFNGSDQISPTLLTSQNGNMVPNTQLDDRSTLRFIPTPQTRDATTSTSFIHGDRFGHPLASSRTRQDREAGAREEANNFTNGDLNTPGSSTGSVN